MVGKCRAATGSPTPQFIEKGGFMGDFMGDFDFLPGSLTLQRGDRADFAALKVHHYRDKSPATFAAIHVARYADRHGARPVGVVVLSWPTLACADRERALRLDRLSPRDRRSWVNANLRTISRVIVHPQFRGIGLASTLVRRCLAESPTRYVEAVAVMARGHPFFVSAGMTRTTPDADDDRPVHHLWDRLATHPAIFHHPSPDGMTDPRERIAEGPSSQGPDRRGRIGESRDGLAE